MLAGFPGQGQGASAACKLIWLRCIWCPCFAHAQGDRRRQGPKLPKLCKTTLLMCSVCAVQRSTIKGQAQQKQRQESIERAIHRQLRHLRGFSGCRRAGSPLLATRAPFFCRKEVICGRWDNERKRCAASAELPVSAMPHASHET